VVVASLSTNLGTMLRAAPAYGLGLERAAPAAGMDAERAAAGLPAVFELSQQRALDGCASSGFGIWPGPMRSEELANG